MRKLLSPLKAIRANCIDCAGGSFKYVKFCPCDGVHGDACALWPYRFGVRPKTVKARGLGRFLDPDRMPDASVPLEQCRNSEDNPTAAPPARKVPPVGHTFPQAAGNRAIGLPVGRQVGAAR